MKKTILFTFLALLIFSVSALAQDANNRYSSTRLDNLISQLKRQTVDLADQTSEGVKNNNANTRINLDEAFLAQQMDASAGFFQQMYQDGRRAAELRDAAAILSDLARRAPNSGSNSNLWRDVQTTIADINRELGNSNGGGGNTNPTATIGRVFWRGMVDAKVQLIIQGNSLRVNTLQGTPNGEGVSSFTSSLPRRNVTVGVNKTKGRGTATVIQQPTRENNFTTIIEINDIDGGAKEYQVEIFWQ